MKGNGERGVVPPDGGQGDGVKHALSPRPSSISEAQLHRSVAAYLRLALKPPTIWTTIGHGGGGRVRGAQLKAMGVQKGWPDLIVVSPSSVIAFELKTKEGRQSPEQKEVAKALWQCKVPYCLCRSVEEVERFLRSFAIPLHASVSASLRKAAA